METVSYMFLLVVALLFLGSSGGGGMGGYTRPKGY